jgi:hypothetical protein
MSPEARERAFDALATEMASGNVSRGKALKLMSAALLGGTLASFPGVAWAAKGGRSSCAKFCQSLFGANTPEEAECVSAAKRGEGPCFTCTTAGGCGPSFTKPTCTATGQTYICSTCQCVCPSGQEACGGSCVSKSCPTGQTFNTSTCKCECPTGYVRLGNDTCALPCDRFTSCPRCGPVQTECLSDQSGPGAYCGAPPHQCTSDLECGEPGQPGVCFEGNCTPLCTSDTACPSGNCFSGNCTCFFDTDCPSGQFCSDQHGGICVAAC